MPRLFGIAEEAKGAASREGTARLRSSADQPEGRAARFPALNYEAATVLAVGVLFSLGVVLQLTPLNGSLRLIGWEWPWRGDVGIMDSLLLLAVPFAFISYALRMAEQQRSLRVSLCLGLLAVGNLLMQIMGILTDRRGIGLVQQIVLSPITTSYFSDASQIHGLAQWFRHFDHARLAVHSSTHPPGPILFYYIFFKLFGSPTGAMIGGITVGCLASLGVLVTYEFTSLWTDNRRIQVTASALYALVPAISVFFPELDQVYPIFAMLLILFWCRSLESRKKIPSEALYFGLTLAVSLFFADNLLTIGAFLAYYGLYWAWRQRWTKLSFVTFLRNSVIGVGVCAGVYLLLWVATGYDPIAVFFNVLSNQAVLEALMNRSSALFGLFDPLDFFLGAGMMVLPLILFQLGRNVRGFDRTRTEVALTLIGLATILTIDLSGVLRGEAARVWLFLQPLVVVPAALELARFEWRWRLAIFSMQWLIVVFLKANLGFVNP